MVYGHFDVQPPDPLDVLGEPAVRAGDPRRMALRPRRRRRQGPALPAAEGRRRSLAAEGALPVNVRVCCDGEEEIGGHSIVEFLAEDERGADACIIFDGGMAARDVPAFEVATRGLAYFHVRVAHRRARPALGRLRRRRAQRDHALMQTLSAVLAGADGRLPEPLRAGLAPPTEQELADWAALPAGRRTSSPARARGRWTRRRPRSSTSARSPSRRVDVHGIEGGSPHLQKTVLPVLAEANLSIRLAPGQDVDDDRATRSSGCCATRCPRAPTSRSSGSRRRRRGSSRPTRRPCSSASTRSSACSASGRCSCRTGGTLPIVPGARRPRHPDDPHRLRAHGEQRPLAERAAAGALLPARRRRPRGSSSSALELAALTGVGLVLAHEPRVAEAPHRVDDRQQRAALLRQLVLDPRRDARRSCAARARPPCSSARRRSERVRGLIPAHECSSSEKRRAPFGQVVDEDRRPLRADDLRTRSDRAGLVVDRVHRAYLPRTQCSSLGSRRSS